MQTPSWQDISSNYTTEDEDGPPESTAVVCDINKEMLKVGKQKADSMGISAGRFVNIKLLQVSQSETDFSLDLEVLVSMFTCTQVRFFGISPFTLLCM